MCLLSLLPDAPSAITFLRTMPLHSSEPRWIHLCHLRSLPSPALVFTELTCVYLYSCPPVFTVPYPPHVRPETPPQAGLHTESCSGHPEERKRPSGVAPCPLVSTVSPMLRTPTALSQTSGALTWPGAHWSAFLSSSLCNPSSQVHEHPHSCSSSLCSTLLLLHTRWPSESAGNRFPALTASASEMEPAPSPALSLCSPSTSPLLGLLPLLAPRHDDGNSPVHPKDSGIFPSCSPGLPVWLMAAGSPERKGGHCRVRECSSFSFSALSFQREAGSSQDKHEAQPLAKG